MTIESDDGALGAAAERVRGALEGEPDRGADVALLIDAADALARLRIERTRERRAYDEVIGLLRGEPLRRGEVGEVVRDATRLATACLGVGRSSVWRYTNDGRGLVCLDLFLSADGAHERGVELSSADFPAYFEALRVGGVIAAHDANRDPRTAEFSEEYLAPLGIGAMLDVPIRAGGRVMGVLCNEHIGGPRSWTESDERIAWMLADLLGLAVEIGERECALMELRAAIGEPLRDDAGGAEGGAS